MQFVSTSSAPQSPAPFQPSVQPLLRGLRGSALRLTRNPYDADDLLQETTLRAWRFWAHYEPGSNLRAWLHRILLNTFVNGYRRARREREVLAQAKNASELFVGEIASASPQDAGLSDELARGLAELPADFRATLWAVAVDELSYREAAEALGCPIGTIMSRLHRARNAMQGALQPAALAHGYG
jgi:RNA polymerase sigma-70 factor (ECF subfamily)